MGLSFATLALLLTALPLKAVTVAQAIASDRRPAHDKKLDAGRKPQAVLELLELAPGQRVLDVVAGAGYGTRLLAELVGPEGVVYAHSTRGLMAEEGLGAEWSGLKRTYPNVRLILGIPGQMPIPDRLDRVLFHLTFHDLWWESAEYQIPRMDPDLFLRQLYAAMAPGGILLVVDHVAKPGADPRAETMARHRIDPAVVKPHMKAAGFVLDGGSGAANNAADDHSLMVYDKAIRGRTDRFMLRFRKPHI